MISILPTLKYLLAIVISAHWYGGLWTNFNDSSIHDPTQSPRFNCYPFLPDLFKQTPPTSSHHLIQTATARVDGYLRNRFETGAGDIESLSIAIVTGSGPLYEGNFGRVRSNGSEQDRMSSPPTTRHAMYRLASVSKLFEVVEGHVLKQRGALSWDDPVSKYLPQFTYCPEGYGPSSLYDSLATEPITLYHLATHLSGLGHDWPSGNVAKWPLTIDGAGAPPMNGLPFPSVSDVLESISHTRLVSPPGLYPSYSNTATGILGIALVAANQLATGDGADKEPGTYTELVRRDVFDPMGLNASHFLATEQNKDLLVVPSLQPDIADFDFLDAMNAAGGQWSSLSDLVIFTSTLLNPNSPNSVLTPYTMANWLHAAHAFEEDDWTESGLIWEIVKAKDSNGRLRRIYWKLGELYSYHSAVALHPGTSYGVAAPTAGPYPDAAAIAYNIFDIVQPYMDTALAELATLMYAGRWASADGNSTATILVERGTLFVEDFVLNGTDALATLGHPPIEATATARKRRVALRSTGRRDELRLDVGTAGFNGLKHMGCYSYWIGSDDWGMSRGAPTNLVYFTGSAEGWEKGHIEERVLHVPAMGDLEMRRQDIG
ncbi:beta-lactamase/transpeptidase-like protein [Wolfiporia cocos MD-104 SS10]|uniref:Beta-lactamase/transpeptidase-like protein n=1 Tax=Wolfiporia cocos (strain MD-104) TaxID=742152 RepID=A0A2H3IV15_WOLCO|nr:beta-lactamase/transpeptidase-like protein [Wolfiporia cocos MD-104 SS10]